jgi:hypothetical protein
VVAPVSPQPDRPDAEGTFLFEPSVVVRPSPTCHTGTLETGLSLAAWTRCGTRCQPSIGWRTTGVHRLETPMLNRALAEIVMPSTGGLDGH